MPAVQIVTSSGRIKKTFNADVDPGDSEAAHALLRKWSKILHLSGASIKIKSRKGGWVTHQ